MSLNNGAMGGGKGIIGEETSITLRTLWSIVGVVVPVGSLLLVIYISILDVRNEIKSVNSSVHAIQAQVSDRWTRSMMVLFATELENKNRHTLTNLVVPNPEEIAHKIPAEYRFAK